METEETQKASPGGFSAAEVEKNHRERPDKPVAAPTAAEGPVLETADSGASPSTESAPVVTEAPAIPAAQGV